MAAYLRAVEAGADAVECDVRLTSDGTLVLVHDRRIDRTSPGTGAVSDFMLAELQEHTFGGEGRHDFEDPPSELRTRLLTLETFLSTLLDASSTLEFVIETKHPTRFGKYVEEELARVLRAFGLVRDESAHRVRMMSFSRMAMVRMRKLVPGIRNVYLSGMKPWFYRGGRLPPDVTAWGPGIDLVRASSRGAPRGPERRIYLDLPHADAERPRRSRADSGHRGQCAWHRAAGQGRRARVSGGDHQARPPGRGCGAPRGRPPPAARHSDTGNPPAHAEPAPDTHPPAALPCRAGHPATGGPLGARARDIASN
jgi:glycerophosphoryl diester phosphodiesterase